MPAMVVLGRDMIVQAPSLDVGGSTSRAISERTIFQVRLNGGGQGDGCVEIAADVFGVEWVGRERWCLDCILVVLKVGLWMKYSEHLQEVKRTGVVCR